MEKLKQIYRDINQAMVDKDILTLRKLIQPDSLLVHMTGYHQSIEEWLTQIQSEEMKYYSWKERSVQILSHDNHHARLVGQSQVKARIWGSGPYTWRLQIQMDLEQHNGQWLVTHQLASTY